MSGHRSAPRAQRAGDPFTAALGAQRGARRVPPTTDGSVWATPAPRYPYAVAVVLRGDEGHGPAFRATRWVGLTEAGAVGVEAAIAAGERDHPGCLYWDWTAA